MRKSNQQTIGQLLSLFIKQNKLEDRLESVEIETAWKKIVGDFIFKHTTDIRLHKEILFLKIDSPACREELMYKKTALIEAINNFAKKNIVKEIVIK